MGGEGGSRSPHRRPFTIPRSGRVCLLRPPLTPHEVGVCRSEPGGSRKRPRGEAVGRAETAVGRVLAVSGAGEAEARHRQRESAAGGWGVEAAARGEGSEARATEGRDGPSRRRPPPKAPCSASPSYSLRRTKTPHKIKSSSAYR